MRAWPELPKLAMCCVLLLPLMAWMTDSLDLRWAVPLFAAGLFVACMFCHGELARAKPDPRHIAAAVTAAGGQLHRCVMVGDSITDFNAARASGVPVILVPFGYSDVPAATLAADAFCETWDQIPAACVRLLAPGGF